MGPLWKAASFVSALLMLLGAAAFPASAADDTLSSGNKNELIIYGIVTRALLFADDGDRHQLFQIDGSVENTRLGWIARGALNGDITVQGHIEMDAPLSNAPGDINLNGTESVETPWAIRIQEVSAEHARYGKLSLGQGDTASTDRVVIDLSGSDLGIGNNPADMAGGIHFYNKTTGARTVTIGDVIDKVDGIDKDDRIRYDLPGIGGLGLALSHTAGGAWDVGAGYGREFGDFEFEIGAFYANVASTSTTDEALWGGAGSIKHKSGLSLTVTGAVKGQKTPGRNDPHYLWGKIGYSAGLFAIGETHFGLSYGQYNDFSQNGDEATSMGVGVVQDLESIGSNLWLLVRNHELDQAGSDSFDDVFIVSLGTLVNF
ncbi:MAG: porin [Proteobacteria bacterium]|nr:porin [Pseudomonadota bacterium]